jgi:hypothetical protein
MLRFTLSPAARPPCPASPSFQRKADDHDERLGGARAGRGWT